MTDQYPNPTEYTTPPITLIITTFELTEEPESHYFWKAATTHIFHGDTVERVYQIMNSHKETDSFFKASFEGRFPWKGGVIILKNSEPQIV